MGTALRRLVTDAPDLDFAGGIGRGFAEGEMADAILEASDAVIDVSSPALLAEVLDRHWDAWNGRPLVVGTTGLGKEQEERLDALAQTAPVLVAANFSLGVNLLLELVRRAAEALPADAFDAEIVETHHRRKADAPSGTALAIADALARARDQSLGDVRRDGRSGRGGPRPEGEIGLHALRGGAVVGEHRVLFLGARERVELAHAALDRDVFAEGALAAVRWLVGQAPGRYGMNDVIAS